MTEIKITSDNFHRDVLSADRPVILDFWAEWCLPCRLMSPVIADLSEQMKGAVLVGEINIDEESELTRLYNVTVIPTLIRLDRGYETKRLTGVYPREKLSKDLGLELPDKAEQED